MCLERIRKAKELPDDMRGTRAAYKVIVLKEVEEAIDNIRL